MNYLRNLRVHHCAALAVMLASPAIVPALAAESETNVVRVNYADLNLASPAGVAALRHRLIVASGAVCGIANSSDAADRADAMACKQSALQDALGQLRTVVAAAQARSAVAASQARSSVALANAGPN